MEENKELRDLEINDSYDYMKDLENTDKKYEPSTAAKVLLILAVMYLSFIGIAIGIVVGIVYLNEKSQGYKNFGKILLILSAVSLGLNLLLVGIISSLIGNLFSMIIFP